jgi:fermentation-respiration switch protein FrsA (DUF1100 family)
MLKQMVGFGIVALNSIFSLKPFGNGIKTSMSQLVAISILTFVVIAFLLILVLGWIFFKKTMGRRTASNKGGWDITTSPDFDQHKAMSALTINTLERFVQSSAHEEWFIESFDGLKLAAQVYHPLETGHKYILIVHGYTSSAANMLPFARGFVERGFHAVVPDCRAHGKSEGKYITMGWCDRLDLIGWINRILESDTKAAIVLHGVSMGGAAVMMASGENLPLSVCCCVADCGYSSVDDILRYHLQRRFHLPEFPILPVSDWFCRMKAHFSVYEASSVKQLRNCKKPFMFIHGDADRFVPFAMQELVFTAAAGEKQRILVPGAGHGMSAKVLGDEYYTRIIAFAMPYLLGYEQIIEKINDHMEQTDG